MASCFLGIGLAFWALRIELWGRQTPSFVADDEMVQVDLAMLG